MGITHTPANNHWNYFLAIESDFEKTTRYIEFSEDNYSVYSIEFSKLIMTASQEIDGLMKKICKKLVTDERPTSIGSYKTVIQDNIPSFFRENVSIPHYGLSSRPWETWESSVSPLWWRANNKVKHNRTENLREASFKNAFNAIGALYITNLYFLRLYSDDPFNVDYDWIPLYHQLTPKNTLFTNGFDYIHTNVMWAARPEW